jgi:Spy/CpxP family protein refolding chaperone
MKTNAIKLLVALLLPGVLAQAQRHHQPPDPAQMVQHRVSFLTEKLGLSPTQQEQATTIFTNETTPGKSLREQMRTAHQSLKAATKNNDAAGIDQAANTIGSLTTQMISAHAKAEASFVQTLSPDQQAKYSEVRGRGPGMRGFGGPWGPAGAGGPRPF